MNEYIKERNYEKKLYQKFYSIVFIIGAISILIFMITLPFANDVVLGPRGLTIKNAESTENYNPVNSGKSYVIIKKVDDDGKNNSVFNGSERTILSVPELEKRSQNLILIFVDESGNYLERQFINGVFIN